MFTKTLYKYQTDIEIPDDCKIVATNDALRAIELIRGNQIPLYLIFSYMILVFISSTYVNRSFKIGLLSIITSAIQILGYGYGYLKSSIMLIFNKKNIEKVFSEVFFSK